MFLLNKMWLVSHAIIKYFTMWRQPLTFGSLSPNPAPGKRSRTLNRFYSKPYWKRSEFRTVWLLDRTVHVGSNDVNDYQLGDSTLINQLPIVHVFIILCIY